MTKPKPTDPATVMWDQLAALEDLRDGAVQGYAEKDYPMVESKIRGIMAECADLLVTLDQVCEHTQPEDEFDGR